MVATRDNDRHKQVTTIGNFGGLLFYDVMLASRRGKDGVVSARWWTNTGECWSGTVGGDVMWRWSYPSTWRDLVMTSHHMDDDVWVKLTLPFPWRGLCAPFRGRLFWPPLCVCTMVFDIFFSIFSIYFFISPSLRGLQLYCSNFILFFSQKIRIIVEFYFIYGSLLNK